MKIIKPILNVLISVVAIVLFATILNFDNAVAFDTIATFLSITSGFTIAALSIIATSPFSARLHLIEDKDDNSRTLLHILVRHFQHTTMIFVATIGLIILYKFLPTSCCQDIISISLFKALKAIIWYMTILSFGSFVRLFKLFADYVIKSGSEK